MAVKKLTDLRSGTDATGCLIVGEIGQAHDGSLGTAHALLDVIADGGADAVKFQTHIAAAESTPGEPWRVKFSRQDASRFDYWERMEFTEAQWEGLRDHAKDREIAFISSPFSIEAVELLKRVGVDAWKIASGEVTNDPLLQAVAADGRPVLLSSGMSPLEELDRAVEIFRSAGSDLAVLQCTSSYPCPPEDVGINVVSELKARYGTAAGLSDHSGTIFPGIAGAVLGMDVLEVHVTLSRRAFGPDVSSSLLPEELEQLVAGIRFVEGMIAHPIDKAAKASEMASLRALFTKSVVLRRPLPAGTVLTEDHLTVKKPGTGIPASRLPELVGMSLRRDVECDQLLADDDLEPAR